MQDLNRVIASRENVDGGSGSSSSTSGSDNNTDADDDDIDHIRNKEFPLFSKSAEQVRRACEGDGERKNERNTDIDSDMGIVADTGTTNTITNNNNTDATLSHGPFLSLIELLRPDSSHRRY